MSCLTSFRIICCDTLKENLNISDQKDTLTSFLRYVLARMRTVAVIDKFCWNKKVFTKVKTVEACHFPAIRSLIPSLERDLRFEMKSSGTSPESWS